LTANSNHYDLKFIRTPYYWEIDAYELSFSAKHIINSFCEYVGGSQNVMGLCFKWIFIKNIHSVNSESQFVIRNLIDGYPHLRFCLTSGNYIGIEPSLLSRSKIITVIMSPEELAG
jgi:hypothetical protein